MPDPVVPNFDKLREHEFQARSRGISFRPGSPLNYLGGSLKPRENVFPGPYRTAKDLLAAIETTQKTVVVTPYAHQPADFIAQLNAALTAFYAQHPSAPEPPELSPSIQDHATFRIQIDRAKRWLIKFDVEIAGCSPPTHSPDFRSLYVNGRSYKYTAQQAAVMKMLWESVGERMSRRRRRNAPGGKRHRCGERTLEGHLQVRP